MVRLRSQLAFSGAPGHTHSKHLSVLFDRAGPPPPVDSSDWPAHGSDFRCDWAGRDAIPVNFTAESGLSRSPTGMGCPLARAKTLTTSQQNVSSVLESAPARSASTFPASHCYVLNQHLDFRLQWTIRGERIDIEVSAATASDSWVAIGFRPQGRSSAEGIDTVYGTGTPFKFGMVGADIVVGHGDSGAVQTYYSALYTGPPDEAEAALAISDASAEYRPPVGPAAAGRTVLRFTRALSGTGKLAALGMNGTATSILGPNADVLWAVGASVSSAQVFSSDEGHAGTNAATNITTEPTCAYHENSRGLRIVKWDHPEATFLDEWLCS